MTVTRLDGKNVVITGAAGGLGSAIAQHCVDEGARVVLLDRDRDAVSVVAKSLGQEASYSCDVTDESAVRDTLATAAQACGHIDVVVNNAGIEGPNKPTDAFSLDEWNRVMAVNTTAVFLVTKHSIPFLRAAGGGSVINISSIYGLVGGGDIPPYHASKGAVRLMSKNDALTYAPDNIRVNSIHPGFIFTDMVYRYVEDSGMEIDTAREALEAAHPLGTGSPADIAWAVVYLASDQARWMTGSELVIDGGYTAR
ncbi:SDR family NAD(P)-dependent oxidoreductase [Gordonia sp. NPDC062954]|uniref:SDR family NAD(P)-dependent oxidoreductase n=1 Tax=Gordonia sp. NPDC062954 TaxID=3364003 RepID=UPI0037C7D97B